MNLAKAVLAIDIQESDQEIAASAAFLQRMGVQALVLVHIINVAPGNPRKSIERLTGLQEKLSFLNCGFTMELGYGHVASEICRIAKANEADYIYIPRSQKHRVRRLLLGSTTKDVVRLTDLPVLVHKDYPRQNGNRSVKNVLYATDFGAAASRAFGYVPAFGSNDAALTLLHVGERGADPEAEKARQKWVSVRLAEKRASLEGHYGLVRTESLLGAPHRRILQVAKSMAADMILVGRFNDNPIRKIVGSTLERISDKAHCSLFVVP